MIVLSKRLAVAGVSIALLGGASIPCAAGVVLRAVDAVALDTASASLSGDQRAAIQFVNDLDFAVDLYWIDYDGNRIFYATILAGESLLQQTFITHPWILVRTDSGGSTHGGSGRLLAGFLPETVVPVGSPDHDVAYLRALRAGDIVVADADAGAGGVGAIVRIDPVTGSSSIITRGGTPIGATGLVMLEPRGVALAADGELIVVDPLRRRAADGLVVRVNPASGAQSLVSYGGLLEDPMDVAVELDGMLVVTNSSDYGSTPRVVRVDPASGAQTLLAQGGLLRNPWGVAIDAAGGILVTDRGFRGRHAIIRINPQTGAQSIVTSALNDPLKLAIDGFGRILVVESGVRFWLGGLLPLPSISQPSLVRIDPVTGARAEFSARALRGGYFRSVAVGAGGRVLIGENRDDNVGTVYQVDLLARRYSVLARSSGFPLNDPLGLLVVPEAR